MVASGSGPWWQDDQQINMISHAAMHNRCREWVRCRLMHRSKRPLGSITESAASLDVARSLATATAIGSPDQRGRSRCDGGSSLRGSCTDSRSLLHPPQSRVDPAAAEIYHRVDPPERGKSSPRTVHVRELAQCTRCQSPCARLAGGRVAPWRRCWDDRKGRGGVIQSAFRLTTARSQLSEIC